MLSRLCGKTIHNGNADKCVSILNKIQKRNVAKDIRFGSDARTAMLIG